jgi:hypothetical protein
MKENKALFVSMLNDALTVATDEVRKLEYEKDPDGFEAVTIVFKGGTKHTFNVTGFNYAFILREVGYILSR